MAGAEAEIELIGFCEKGDGDDRREIAAMIASRHSGAPDDGFDRLDARLRRATAAIVRRHIGRICALGEALLKRDVIADDDEIRAVASLAPPLSNGGFGSLSGTALPTQSRDYPDTSLRRTPKPVGPATDLIGNMDEAIDKDGSMKR